MSQEISFRNLKGREIYNCISSKASCSAYSTLQNFVLEQAKELGQDRSFYTIDLGDILWKAQLWKEKFPSVDAFYAVKANSDPVVLRLLALLGFGFDCSTQGEIRAALGAGAHSSKIIYAHTVKIPSGLHYAQSVGVNLLTFDSEEELVKISKHFPEARLVLRLKPDCVHNLEVYDLGKKYGCSLDESHKLLQKAKDLNLDVVGASFHAGGLCDNPETYTTLISNCRAAFDSAEMIGHKPYIVDIGAGFHGTHSKEGFFCKLSNEIRKSLQLNFASEKFRKIAEPGTYFIGSAANLVTTIIGKKKLPEGNNSGIEVAYYVNDGYYDSFFKNYELYESVPEPVLSTEEVRSRRAMPSKLWGQTCCSEDVVAEQCHLVEMYEGEQLLWRNVGAYNRMVCSGFTQVPLPAIRHVFIDNPRLDLKWIENAEGVIDFIVKSVVPVAKDLSPDVQNGSL